MRILFVCSGNAFRSPVAEALLKKMEPKVEVDSAGTHPSIPIPEAVKKYLARENAILSLKGEPEHLNVKKLKSYDVIVAMENKHKDAILNRCSECENKIIVWNIKDPYFLPAEYTEKIFDQIKRKIKELANSI